jgi:hypothetical protein
LLYNIFQKVLFEALILHPLDSSSLKGHLG